MILETKLDDNFPVVKLFIKLYSSPYRDWNSQEGEILLFAREDIPSKLLTEDASLETFFIDINFRKREWLLCCSYNPNRNNSEMQLNCLSKALTPNSSEYEKFITLRYFDVDTDNNHMQVICNTFNFESLIAGPTCFKKFEKPSCIRLILTNRHRSFDSFCVFENDLQIFTE